MILKRKSITALSFLLITFTLAVSTVEGKDGSEYKAIVKHLKTKYKAKKVKIPFMWLARFAVSTVRPAGVKSFSVTIFEDLKFSRETLDTEMRSLLKNSFSPEWSPVLRVRSRAGEQAYMYMREAGGSIKITVVTINNQQAAVIRATFSPEKLVEFLENPKIFGVSLENGNPQAVKEISKPEENTAPEEKSEEPEKDN